MITHPDSLARHLAGRAATCRRLSSAPNGAGDASPAVRRALAAREKLPRKIAETLLADPEPAVRLTMARRHDARPEHLRALVADPDPRVRRVVAALGVTDPAAAFADDDPKVRRNAVARAGVDELAPHLDRLVADPDPGVRELVGHVLRNRSPAALAVLAADPEPAVRRAAAGNYFTPEAALAAFAGDADLAVVAAVAANPYTPPAALAAIADAFPADFSYSSLGDHDVAASHRWDIVNDLLDHPRTPPEALRVLHAKNPPYFHAGNAMTRPNWPPDLVIEFALSYSLSTLDDEQERESWREIDAARRDEPLDQVLAMMLRSPIYYVHGAAAANRHTPPEALASYAHTADRKLEDDHLDCVAKNPATPVEILEVWAAKGKRRHEMLKNPDLPASVLEIIAAGSGRFDPPQARIVLAVRASRLEASC